MGLFFAIFVRAPGVHQPHEIGAALDVASSASGHGNSKIQFIKCYLMVQLNDRTYSC
jgi:hypothetical protein